MTMDLQQKLKKPKMKISKECEQEIHGSKIANDNLKVTKVTGSSGIEIKSKIYYFLPKLCRAINLVGLILKKYNNMERIILNEI